MPILAALDEEEEEEGARGSQELCLEADCRSWRDVALPLPYGESSDEMPDMAVDRRSSKLQPPFQFRALAVPL